jgi:ATP-binding protein involved in chromosome partitioning
VPLLGIIENMSYYVCPHCGRPEYLFGQGGGERLSLRLRTALLAQVPLDPAVRAGSDSGQPSVVSAPQSPAGQAFRQVAGALLARIETVGPRAIPYTYVPDPDLKIVG